MSTPLPPLAHTPVLANWTAAWIWCGAEAAARNRYAFFRRTFETTQPAELRLRITADSFYWLYVDGHFRGRGPARSPLDWYQVDAYTLELGAGAHVLAVLVHHVGEVNATIMTGRPGLLADAELAGAGQRRFLGTGPAWRCLPATAWKPDLPCLMSHFGFWEENDLRLQPHAWSAPDFDDRAWQQATEIGRPPCAPWTRLLRRGIALPLYTAVARVAVIASGTWTAGANDPQGILAKTVALRFRRSNGVSAPLPWHPTPPNGEVTGGWITVDFGRTVSGFVEFECDGAAGGETVELSYDEMITADGVVNPTRSYAHLSDRFFLAPGKNCVRTTHPRGFRYVMLDFAAPAGTTALALHEVRAVEEAYPFVLQGRINADPQLDSFFAKAAETVRICTTDAFTDCPTRERVQWMEDLYMHSLTAMYAFGDTQMVRHTLFQAAQCALPDGRINGFFPSERTNCAFASSSILWLALLAEYGWFSGDADTLERLAPTAARLMQFLESQCDEDGLIARWPAGQFWDWAPIEDSGCLLITNAGYAFALANVQRLPALAAVFPGDIEARLRQLRAAAQRRFWDESRQFYADLRQADGTPGSICSQDANVMAVLGGICPADQRQELLRRLIAPQNLGPVPVGEHSLKKEMRPGLTKLVPCGTLWFGFWLCRALFENGLDREAIAQMRQLWGACAELPTFPETRIQAGNTGHCHGWASGPAYLLIAYVLGLQATAPGWAQFRACPHPGDLPAASGRVMTPRGPVEVSWEQRDGRLDVRVHPVVL